MPHIPVLFIVSTLSFSLLLAFFSLIFYILFLFPSFTFSLTAGFSLFLTFLPLCILSALRGVEDSGSAQAEGHVDCRDSRHAASPPLHCRGPASSTWFVIKLTFICDLK